MIINLLLLIAFVASVFVVWYIFYSTGKSVNYVNRKEHDQRFPVKDKHLKIWRDWHVG